MELDEEHRNQAVYLGPRNERLNNLYSDSGSLNFINCGQENETEIFSPLKVMNEQNNASSPENNLLKDRVNESALAIKKEPIDSYEDQLSTTVGLCKFDEVQFEKEQVDSNTNKFCDVNMDVTEESTESEHQSSSSEKVLVKREPVEPKVDINPLEFCDVKMDVNEESAEADHQSSSSGKVTSSNGGIGSDFGDLSPSSSSSNNPYDPKRMVRCPECSNLFTKNYIKVHVLNHSKEIFQCSKCSYSTNRKERLELHVLNHLETKTFQCEHCSYATNIHKYFKEHVKIHTERRVFTCSKCDYQTNIKKYLREHVMIHTEKKLFKCSKCYYETNRKDRLRIHEQNHSDHSEVKRFHCGHCDFRTNIKRVLKDHELTHLEATMFHCHQCEYTTNFKSSLNRHTRTHYKKTALATG